jgi:tetratricopeptide (TPR) repeat protein
MKKFFLILCMSFPFLSVGKTDVDIYKYNVQMADLLYQHHYFYQNIDIAIDYYKRAFAQKETEDIYWKLTRALWIKQEKKYNPEEKKELLVEARRYIKEAVKNYPQNIDIRLWHAIINGSYVRNSEFLESLLFLTEGVKNDLEFVIANRKDSARGLFALGAYYYYLPIGLGGDFKKAITFFQRALEVDPKFHRGNLFLAKAYFQEGQVSLAIKNLTTILKAKDSEEIGFLFAFQSEARLLLEQYQK